MYARLLLCIKQTVAVVSLAELPLLVFQSVDVFKLSALLVVV